MIAAVLGWLTVATLHGVLFLAASRLVQIRALRSRRFRLSWAVTMTAALCSGPFVHDDTYLLFVMALNAWALSIALTAYASAFIALLIPIHSLLACLSEISYFYPWDADEVFGFSLIVGFLLFHAWTWHVLLYDLQHQDLLSLGLHDTTQSPQP